MAGRRAVKSRQPSVIIREEQGSGEPQETEMDILTVVAKWVLVSASKLILASEQEESTRSGMGGEAQAQGRWGAISQGC